MGIASFVLGIVSILSAIFGFGFAWVALVTGTVGIVLGVIARNNYGGSLATAGFVMSIIGTSLGLFALLLMVLALSWVGSLIGSFV